MSLSTNVTGSLKYIVTITFPFVNSVVLYSTVTSGAILSIFSITICVLFSFPASSTNVIVSFVFIGYAFWYTFPSSFLNQVSLSTNVTGSLKYIVTITFPFVGSVVLYSTVTSGAVLS